MDQRPDQNKIKNRVYINERTRESVIMTEHIDEQFHKKIKKQIDLINRRQANYLKCNTCGSPLTLEKKHKIDGDEDNWIVELRCININIPKFHCGKAYPIGYIKNENDLIFQKSISNTFPPMSTLLDRFLEIEASSHQTILSKLKRKIAQSTMIAMLVGTICGWLIATLIMMKLAN